MNYHTRYTLTRTGSFKLYGPSSACKAPGHTDCSYELQADAHGTVRLDGLRYVVPHEVLDDAIQSAARGASGTCEQVADLLADFALAAFAHFNPSASSVTLTVRPDGPDTKAFVRVYKWRIPTRNPGGVFSEDGQAYADPDPALDVDQTEGGRL